MVRILETDIYHENKTVLLEQEQAAKTRQRIEEMKAKNTNLFIGQPEAVQSDDECYQEIAAAGAAFLNERTEEKELELARTLEKHNLQLYCYPFVKTSHDKKLVAHMAFHGYVDSPSAYWLNPKNGKSIQILSNLFMRMKDNPLERAQTKPEDYDLSYSTVWNVFKQVPEFAAIEDKVKRGLTTWGIPPERLAELNAKDFCFIINEEMRKADKGGATKVFQESYKARHTKRFISENEAEFRAGLLAMPGVRADYVDTLIKAMKRGMTDITKFRENGQLVWKEEWANQPVVDVHHILNIKDSSAKETEGKSFINVNDYENMCFIVRYPQHNTMHALEQDLEGNYHNDIFENREVMKNMYYRIQPPEGVRCMLGFHNMIYEREYLKLSENQKAELKEKGEQNPRKVSPKKGRGSGQHSNIKDPHAQRRAAKRSLKQVFNDLKGRLKDG